MKIDKIPGIVFRTYAKDNAQLVCKLHMTIGDALDLGRRDEDGKVVNEELRDWLFDKLKEEFDTTIHERKEWCKDDKTNS